MKYGESCFDVFYLLTAILIGILILRKARNRTERWMGTAVLILGCGDAFHLVPRVLNYFVNADFTAALALDSVVLCLLYSGSGLCKRCADAGHADAAENHLLSGCHLSVLEIGETVKKYCKKRI